MRTLTDSDVDAIAEALAAKLVAIQTGSAGQIPNMFLPLGEALKYLPRYKNAAALRYALQQGEFRSGTEAQYRGRRWSINPAAHLARVQKEQQKNKVC
jgi:hypothetical protein